MRDLLFSVADKCIEQAIAGVFDRPAWDQVIGCRRFDFDSRQDIKVAAGRNDCGLFSEGCELVRPFQGEYRRVVMIVDEAWDGSPGASAIEARLGKHLTRAGWTEEDGLGLAVCPESDVWLWSNSLHSAQALGWDSWDELHSALRAHRWLDGENLKPSLPKEAARWALRNGAGRAVWSAALFRHVSSRVSLSRCADDALARLLDQLRIWFPVEAT